MTQHAAPRVTWHARWLRGLWPDHNPLRRAADRAEAAIIAGLLAAFAIGAPLAALVARQWSYAAGLRVEYAQQSARHQVSAVLLADAPYSPYGGYQAQTRARWTARDGTPRSGEVSVPVGARAGSTALVWVDASGALTAPPILWPGRRRESGRGVPAIFQRAAPGSVPGRQPDGPREAFPSAHLPLPLPLSGS